MRWISDKRYQGLKIVSGWYSELSIVQSIWPEWSRSTWMIWYMIVYVDGQSDRENSGGIGSAIRNSGENRASRILTNLNYFEVHLWQQLSYVFEGPWLHIRKLVLTLEICSNVIRKIYSLPVSTSEHQDLTYLIMSFSLMIIDRINDVPMSIDVAWKDFRATIKNEIWLLIKKRIISNCHSFWNA